MDTQRPVKYFKSCTENDATGVVFKVPVFPIEVAEPIVEVTDEITDLEGQLCSLIDDLTETKNSLTILIEGKENCLPNWQTPRGSARTYPLSLRLRRGSLKDLTQGCRRPTRRQGENPQKKPLLLQLQGMHELHTQRKAGHCKAQRAHAHSAPHLRERMSTFPHSVLAKKIFVPVSHNFIHCCDFLYSRAPSSLLCHHRTVSFYETR